MSENESKPTEAPLTEASATGASEPVGNGQTPPKADGEVTSKVRLRDRLSGLKWLGADGHTCQCLVGGVRVGHCTCRLGPAAGLDS